MPGSAKAELPQHDSGPVTAPTSANASTGIPVLSYASASPDQKLTQLIARIVVAYSVAMIIARILNFGLPLLNQPKLLLAITSSLSSLRSILPLVADLGFFVPVVFALAALGLLPGAPGPGMHSPPPGAFRPGRLGLFYALLFAAVLQSLLGLAQLGALHWSYLLYVALWSVPRALAAPLFVYLLNRASIRALGQD